MTMEHAGLKGLKAKNRYSRGEHFNPFSAGTDFTRQFLTSTEILTSKVDPRSERVK